MAELGVEDPQLKHEPRLQMRTLRSCSTPPVSPPSPHWDVSALHLTFPEPHSHPPSPRADADIHKPLPLHLPCLINPVNWGGGGRLSSLQTRLGRMLQSSDSASACVQTQQEGERGRLSLGPSPKWAMLPGAKDSSSCQGPRVGRKQEVQAGLQEAGLHSPLGVGWSPGAVC